MDEENRQAESTAHRKHAPYWWLLISISLMAIAFSNMPVEFSQSGRSKLVYTGPVLEKGDSARELLLAEHKKVVEEIKFRDQEESDWFRNKMLFTGGLFAFLLGFLFTAAKGVESESDVRTAVLDKVEWLFQTGAASPVFAVASVVVLNIDARTRSSDNLTSQLGLWISGQVEPAFWKFPPWPDGKPPPGSLLPYETYLRVPSNYHEDVLTGWVMWTHLHLLTIVIVLAFIVTTRQLVIRGRDHTRPARFAPRVATGGFVVVHVVFLAFALVAHDIPLNYHELSPLFGLELGPSNLVLYGLVAVAVCIADYAFIFGFPKKGQGQAPSERAEAEPR